LEIESVLRISDIMTRNVFVLPASASADDAAFALVVRDIGAAPVRDDAGRIVGVVSRSDLTDPVRAAGLAGAHGDPARELSAGELMTPGFTAAEASDSAIDAARLLAEEAAHRLLILDADGALAGIVTPTDLLRALAHAPHDEASHDEAPHDEAPHDEAPHDEDPTLH
jgi:CBS-domain-containing membrane protein